MLKYFTIFTSVICYVLAASTRDILTNDLVAADNENKHTELDVVPIQNTPYVYNDSPDDKKSVSIVINPIIHNIAHGHGHSGGGGHEMTTSAPVTTTRPPNVFLEFASVSIRKARYIMRLLVNSAGTLIRTIIRFIICTFVPICGIFSILGDEVDYESVATPERVSRALEFIEDVIQNFHDAQRSA